MKFLQDLTYEKLFEMAAQAGLPAYRAEQLFGWAARGAGYAQMSNVPQKVKEFFIAAGYLDIPVRIIKKITSALDGTVKLLYALQDGNVIEGVLMKYKYGNTLCVSTQVGCRMNCAFCRFRSARFEHLQALNISFHVRAVRQDKAAVRRRFFSHFDDIAARAQ